MRKAAELIKYSGGVLGQLGKSQLSVCEVSRLPEFRSV